MTLFHSRTGGRPGGKGLPQQSRRKFGAALALGQVISSRLRHLYRGRERVRPTTQTSLSWALPLFLALSGRGGEGGCRITMRKKRSPPPDHRRPQNFRRAPRRSSFFLRVARPHARESMSSPRQRRAMGSKRIAGTGQADHRGAQMQRTNAPAAGFPTRPALFPPIISLIHHARTALTLANNSGNPWFHRADGIE